MKKEVISVCLGIALIILSVGIVSASYSYNNHTLENTYQGGGIIRGTLNISFSSESVDSEVRDNLGNSISLLKFLEDADFMENSGFNCTTSGCIADYSDMGEVTDSVDLVSSNPPIIGFIILGGAGIYIDDLTFDVVGDTSPSCIRQLVVDVLDKEEVFLQSRATTGSSCPHTYYSDCFDRDGPHTLADISFDEYCQLIRLPPAPNYEIGAKVTKYEKGKLIMELHGLDQTVLGNCELPDISGTAETKCIVNYSGTETKDYLVCIRSEFGVSTGDYKINSESAPEVCGTAQIWSDVYTIDFEIFANALKFDSPSFSIDDDSFYELTGGESLINYVDDYLVDKYDSDCSNNCFIPFEFRGVSQSLTFSNAGLTYTTDIGVLHTVTELHFLEKAEAKLSSGELIIDLSKLGFEIPVNSTVNIFELYLGGTKIFSEEINISRGISFDVFPKIALIGIDTRFEAITDENISSASWTFGDGSTETTSSTGVIHKYATSGSYTMEVVLTNNQGANFLRTFVVIVGEPRASAEILLEKSKNQIANLSVKLGSFVGWVKAEIAKQVDIDQLNSSVSNLRGLFNNATNDEDYSNIVNAILALNVPDSVEVGSSGEFPILVGSSNINTNYIEDISGEDVPASEEDRLKSNIASWMGDNYDGDIEFEVISAFVDSNENELVTKFKVTLDAIGSSEEQAYFIIGHAMGDIYFKENYSAESVDGGTYIALSGSDETIEFIIPGSVDLVDLGVHISPNIDALGVYEDIDFVEEKFPGLLLIIAMLVLLLIFLIVYILLQEWYKKYYEHHLFPEPNDLYNSINFVYNGRKAGLNDSQIRGQLKGKKWSGEQITYATKKLDGKRTGMWEIPIFRSAERKKVKAEIAKRQAIGQ